MAAFIVTPVGAGVGFSASAPATPGWAMLPAPLYFGLGDAAGAFASAPASSGSAFAGIDLFIPGAPLASELPVMLGPGFASRPEPSGGPFA